MLETQIILRIWSYSIQWSITTREIADLRKNVWKQLFSNNISNISKVMKNEI